MKPTQLIIDVREPFEFDSGHVEGAINIPSTQLMSGVSALEGIDKNTKIIVYCRSGGRANGCIRTLENMGFTNLVNGINADHVAKNHL